MVWCSAQGCSSMWCGALDVACLGLPLPGCACCFRHTSEDLASIVKPGIFIVDDVALPTPITFLVLLGEKAVAAKLTGGGLGVASGGPRVGRLSETGSDNDDREGPSGDEHLYDTSPSLVQRRRRRRHQPFCTRLESRSGKGSFIPSLAHTRCVSRERPAHASGFGCAA